MAHNSGATRPRIAKEKAREENTRRTPTEKAIKAKNANLEMMSRRGTRASRNEERTIMELCRREEYPQRSHQMKLTSHLQKLPEEVFTNRHHDATTFGASLTTREARNVRNIRLPEFGATVLDIGPNWPKSFKDITSNLPFGKLGPTLCGPTSWLVNLQKIKT
ncbi:hypothetical protein PIB30_074673 [Stylosanthes scabra]|uniref:Uncharacterized protein n=1 Tax=Stylosanthes scabra TaxID=79078 RepID=A0ABU6YP54_9FABA|nr:hypothetical protein [Stylosanthes scabra]